MSNFYTEPFVSAGEMEFPSQPYITAQPQNHTATGPEEYVLTVIAAGAVSYQWEVFDGESWSTIPGATSDTLTINIDSSMDGWRYRVIVTGADGSTVISKAAQIAVRGVHEITLEGAIVTFTGPARIKSLEVDINPVQSGNGDPSPTNIRPISGWDAVKVFVRGTNQWDEDWELANINLTTYIFTPATSGSMFTSKNYIPVVQGQAYYINVPSGMGGLVCGYTDDSGNGGRQLSGSLNTAFTIPNDVRYIKFGLPVVSYGTTYNNDISINYPSTNHEYHAYNGTTYPISLGQTVYGGVLDVVSGVLTVTHALIDLGDLNWTSEDSYLQGMARATVGVAELGAVYSQTPLCSTLKGTLPNSYLSVEMDSVCFSNSPHTPFLRVRSQGFSGLSDAEIKTALTGAQFVYELATPTTITLTPTEVTTLLGVNNIWADCGDVAVTIIR